MYTLKKQGIQMKIDFQPLQLKLLKFSKYKVFEEEGSETICKNAIKKLKALRDEGDETQKYITTFIIFDNKIVERIDQRLDKFTLRAFSSYEVKKEKVKILSYCFNISNKTAKNKYHIFLATVSQEEIKCKLKDDFNFIKQYISPFLFLLTGLVLFFTYLGFSEYGIPDSYITDIASISFLIIASIVFILVLGILSISVTLYLLIPLSLCGIPGCSWFTLFIVICIYIILFLTIFRLKKPLLMNQLNRRWIDFTRSLSIIMGIVVILIFGFLLSQSIFSSLIRNTNFNKSAYEFIMDVYFSNYSGYPKILTKNGKTYYLPVKDNKYYYIYDVQEVKKKYFNLLLKKNNTIILDKICSSQQNKLAFKRSYILNNPYIKPKHLKEQIPINAKDMDIHIEDFNMSKLITLTDINVSLCQKMINNPSHKVK